MAAKELRERLLERFRTPEHALAQRVDHRRGAVDRAVNLDHGVRRWSRFVSRVRRQPRRSPRARSTRSVRRRGGRRSIAGRSWSCRRRAGARLATRTARVAWLSFNVSMSASSSRPDEVCSPSDTATQFDWDRARRAAVSAPRVTARSTSFRLHRRATGQAKRQVLDEGVVDLRPGRQRLRSDPSKDPPPQRCTTPVAAEGARPRWTRIRDVRSRHRLWIRAKKARSHSPSGRCALRHPGEPEHRERGARQEQSGAGGGEEHRQLARLVLDSDLRADLVVDALQRAGVGGGEELAAGRLRDLP